MPNSNQVTSMEIDQAELDQLKQQLNEDLNKTGITKLTYHSNTLDKVAKILFTTNVSDISLLKTIQQELLTSPKDLITLINALGNDSSEYNQIIFNQKISKLILKLHGIDVKKDNSAFLIALKKQLEDLNISELRLFSEITNKIKELSSLQKDLDIFVDKNIKSGDLKNIITNLPAIIKKEQNNNINILLNHFNENQICDITDDNAQSICEILLSICSIKNFDHAVCFKLIERIIESGSLKNEYYPGLAKKLVEYSGAERPLNNVIRHLTQNSKKQNNVIDLSNLLDVAVGKLKSENVNVILNWCNFTIEECQDEINKLQKKKESFLNRKKQNKSDIEKLDKITIYFKKMKLNKELNKELKEALSEKENNPNKGCNKIVRLLNQGANFKIISKTILTEIAKKGETFNINEPTLTDIRSYLDNLTLKEASRAENSLDEKSEVMSSDRNKFILLDIINIIRTDVKNYPLTRQQWDAMINFELIDKSFLFWQSEFQKSLNSMQEFTRILIQFNSEAVDYKQQLFDSLLIDAIKRTKPDIVELLLKNGANLTDIEPENTWLQLALRKNAKEQDKILEILKILTSKMMKSEDQLSKSVTGLLNKAIELNQSHILDFIFDTSYMKNLVARQQFESKLTKNENRLKTKMDERNTLSSNENRHNLDSDIEKLKSEQMMLIEEWLEHVQFKKLVDKIEEETNIENLSNVEKCLEYYEQIYKKSGPECLKERLNNLGKNIEAKKNSLSKRSAAINSEEMDIDYLTRGIKRLGSSSPIGSRSKSPRMFQQSQSITPSQNDEGPMEANYTPSP